MISERDAEMLMLGALAGKANIKTYLAFMDGWTGLRAELAEYLGIPNGTAATQVDTLRGRKLLRICGWDRGYAVYALANGEPDVPRPPMFRVRTNPKTAKIVANYEKRVAKVQENIEALTKHGVKETRGNVTVHRMR